jgi:hypothetical protein
VFPLLENDVEGLAELGDGSREFHGAAPRAGFDDGQAILTRKVLDLSDVSWIRAVCGFQLCVIEVGPLGRRLMSSQGCRRKRLFAAHANGDFEWLVRLRRSDTPGASEGCRSLPGIETK